VGFAREKVVTIGVELFFAVSAGGWAGLAEMEFLSEKEVVGIRVEMVVRESLG
jgi:hypothetical protein